MRGLLFPSLLYVLWRTSFAMASQCNVFSSTYDKYLKNHMVQSIPNTNLQNCTDQCIVAGFCRSTNFHFESKSCELNIADKHYFPNDYTERQGYSYGGWRTKKPVPQSCSEAKARKRSVKSGYYLIRTKRGKILTVYCDMEKYDGGWTLVVSVSAANKDHLQREENNCIVDSGLCVEYETTAVQARKLSDQDIIDIMSEYGTFRIDVLSDSPYTVFYEIPSGAQNFDSSCTGQGPPACPRIIISHHYPYQWESNTCNNISVGYKISADKRHSVFDGHDDAECGSQWHSSFYVAERVLYGYRVRGRYGIFSGKQGLVFVK